MCAHPAAAFPCCPAGPLARTPAGRPAAHRHLWSPPPETPDPAHLRRGPLGRVAWARPGARRPRGPQPAWGVTDTAASPGAGPFPGAGLGQCGCRSPRPWSPDRTSCGVPSTRRPVRPTSPCPWRPCFPASSQRRWNPVEPRLLSVSAHLCVYCGGGGPKFRQSTPFPPDSGRLLEEHLPSRARTGDGASGGAPTEHPDPRPGCSCGAGYPSGCGTHLGAGGAP